MSKKQITYDLAAALYEEDDLLLEEFDVAIKEKDIHLRESRWGNVYGLVFYYIEGEEDEFWSLEYEVGGGDSSYSPKDLWSALVDVQQVKPVEKTVVVWEKV